MLGGRNRAYLSVILAAFIVCGLLWSVSGIPAALAKPVGVIEMNDKEAAWLAQHRDLRLGMWLDSPPFMFRGSDGAMQGLIPAYTDIVIQKLGLTPKRIRASNFAALWELAKAQEIDVVTAVSAGPERNKKMLLSEPYLYLPIVIITKADHPAISGLIDLNDRTVAVDDGHVAHLRIPEDYPNVNLMSVANVEQGLQVVLAGQADAYVAAQASIDYYIREFEITDVRLAASTEYSYRVSFGVRKDWPILVTLINRALADISKEERLQINDYWIVLRDSDWIDRPYVWRIVGGVVISSLFLVSLIVVWNRKLAREVQGRMHAEAQYRRANESMEKVVESADVIILGLDFTGHVKLFNRAAEEVTGYSRDEILDKNWFELVVPAERFPYAKEEFNRLVSDSGSINQSFENPIITKAGETRHVRWTNSMSRTQGDDIALISFGTDITDQLMAEEELRLTQFAMDNAAVGICRVKPSGRIVYANRTALRMLDYPTTELLQKTIPDVVGDYDRESWMEFWQTLKSRQKMTFENTMIRHDGSTFPAEVSAYYLLFKGTELAIGFFSDISERKRVEGLRDDVERMVRHDLRSPTLAVQTLFKLLHKADNLTDTQREILDSVMGAGKRMLNIIDMSRVLYLMERNDYVLRPRNVDLLDLLESILVDLLPYRNVKNLEVLISVNDAPVGTQTQYNIRSEEMLCYGLLSNLLKNAMEAAPENSTIEVDFSRGNNHVFTIHNMGVVPEEVRETFFDKFVTHGKREGTGLGTYTAHLIATSLGGRISFTTSEEGGTTLVVTLPEVGESDS